MNTFLLTQGRRTSRRSSSLRLAERGKKSTEPSRWDPRTPIGGNMKERNFQLIKTNGITLRTVVEGKGPLVVLLHGFPQCWYLWRHQIDPLVDAGFQVAVPDQRGYGGSDRPEAIEAYNVIELTNDVAGLATALGHEQFIIVGHDWGAPVAWHTALLHPQRTRAVAGLSVPYTRWQAGTVTRQENFGDNFWYMVYFQKPGV